MPNLNKQQTFKIKLDGKIKEAKFLNVFECPWLTIAIIENNLVIRKHSVPLAFATLKAGVKMTTGGHTFENI